jgi:hypothetical protein
VWTSGAFLKFSHVEDFSPPNNSKLFLSCDEVGEEFMLFFKFSHVNYFQFCIEFVVHIYSQRAQLLFNSAM